MNDLYINKWTAIHVLLVGGVVGRTLLRHGSVWVRAEMPENQKPWGTINS